MKVSTPVALSALLTLTTATPLAKRDVDVVTVIDEVVVTVDVTTTINGFPPTAPSATTDHANHLSYHQNLAAGSQSPPPPPPPPTSTPAAAPVVEQKQAVQPAPTTSAAGTPQTPEQIQEAENAKQASINAAQKSADFAHQNSMNALQNGGGASATVPVVQQPSQAPASQAPASQAPATSQSASSGGTTPPPTSGGSCGSVGGACSGDVTIYNDQGLGACGWTNDTNSEDFFALAAPMFGTYTNDAPGPHKNAFCGRTASITVNGKSFTGTLTDRCGGCSGQSIDLSQHLFSQLYPNEPPGNGRYHNVPWEFTSQPIYSGAS